MKPLQVLDEVKGIKKRRDFLILQELAEGARQVEVAERFGLHKSVISRIAKKNRALLDDATLKAELSKKAGRLRIAYQEIRRKRGSSKKDLLEWLEYVRRELAEERGNASHNRTRNRRDKIEVTDFSENELDEIIEGYLRKGNGEKTFRN